LILPGKSLIFGSAVLTLFRAKRAGLRGAGSNFIRSGYVVVSIGPMNQLMQEVTFSFLRKKILWDTKGKLLRSLESLLPGEVVMNYSSSHDRSVTSSFTPYRRRFLFRSAVAISTIGTTGMLGINLLSNVLAQTPRSPKEGFAAFMQLSQYLTAKAALDAELGRAIYAGLVDDDPAFSTQVAALNDLLQHSPTPAGKLQKALDSGQPTLAATPKRIMAGWYLGVVGSGAKARAVAYEQALMYAPISDVIVMPTYARGVPGYWAQPPHLSPS
jgi:hypothetical protein